MIKEWRLAEIKNRLATGRFSERESLTFVFLTFLLIFGYPELLLRLPPEMVMHTNAETAGIILIFVFGTYAAFDANAGPKGRDFLLRYVVLSWTISLRVGVAWMLALGFAEIGIYILLPEDPRTDPLVDAIFSAAVYAIELTVYWRLVVHLRDLAKSTTPAAAPA